MNVPPGLESKFNAARDLLSRSRRVAAFSGAGLSAESGLSTFRDPDSDALWSHFNPTELASVSGFEANPQRVIDWYNWRRRKHAAAQPNAAHHALADQRGMVQITQNVDNLLEQAGVAEQHIYHLHGSILYDQCHASNCDYREFIDMQQPRPLRTCPRCGDWLRPGVVWFGECLPEATWLAAQQLCMTQDCLLVIGTSASVYPAAGLIDLARHQGCRIIVIDPNPGAASAEGDIFLQTSAGTMLPRLLHGFDFVS